MRRLLLILIKLYQYTLSPLLGNRCRFTPSCSSYAIMAIEKHSVLKGLYLTVARLLRCHPWSEGGHDPVP